MTQEEKSKLLKELDELRYRLVRVEETFAASEQIRGAANLIAVIKTED